MACVPTVTMRLAPRTSAISSAMSSLVPARGDSLAAHPEPVQPLGLRRPARTVACGSRPRRPPGSALSLTGVPVRRTRWANPSSPATTMSGRCPAARSASAPASTPDQHRALLADEPPQPREVLAVVEAAAPPPRPDVPAILVASGTPSPCSSSSCSRRRNSVVLWVKLCSCVDSPLRASSISEPTSSAAELGARGDRLAHRARTAPSCTRTGSPSRSLLEHLGARRLHHQDDSGAGQQLGPEVRVAAGDERRGVDHRTHPAVDQGLGTGRSRSRWSITAMSPGRSRSQQRAGPAVDADGAAHPGLAFAAVRARGESS